ncbi:MAG: T9SS type A sorting domain-containing protein [Bacteroidota bacterium]
MKRLIWLRPKVIFTCTIILFLSAGSAALMAQLPDLPAVKINRWNNAGVTDGIPELPAVFTSDNAVTVVDKTDTGIQTAINSAKSQGKAWVYLPDGFYNLADQVDMTSDVSLVGESRAGVKVLIKFNNRAGFAMFKDQNCGIYRMTISGRFPKGDGTFYITPQNKWGCDTCNELPDVTNVSINMNNTDNCWVDDVNIYNSGRHPINISNDSYHNTIRNVDIKGAFNKGGGANGYLFIKGQDNLLTRSTVTEIRHISIQTSTSEYNVIYDKDFRQEVSFHAEDAGNNLIEFNRITLPADMPDRYYAIMGTWSIQHNMSLADNYLYRNDCIEENHGGARLYGGQFGPDAKVYAGPLDGKKEAIAAGRPYDHTTNFDAKYAAPAVGAIYLGDPLTSIEEGNLGAPSGSNSIRLYPNPARDVFYMKLDREVKEAEVKLYSASGRLVWTQNKMNSQNGEIACRLDPGIRKGIYFLVLEEGLTRVRYTSTLFISGL